MKINPNNIKTGEQAKVYKSAMSFKSGIDDMMKKMMDMDDKVDIDFNRERGLVSVTDQPLGPGGEKMSGEMKFDPKTGKVESFEGGNYSYNVKKGFLGGEKEVYEYKDGHWFLDAVGRTEKLVVDKETGEINHKEYEWYDTDLLKYEL